MTDTDVPIDVEDLTFRYPGTDEPVLDGASLTVEQGEFLAVVGGNGSGKTTLCKAFNGIIPHFFEGEFSGTVTVNGTRTRDASVSELSRDVGYVFQEFDNQLVTPTAYEEVAFAPMNYGQADYREKVETTLSTLGLEALADRFVWELSGGQKHLLALAAALSLDPDVLVIDEPAAQLDPVTAIEVYDHLARLNSEQGKTIVAIEHHTEFVAEYCDSVALVDNGAVSWKRPTQVALNKVGDLREQSVHPPQVARIAERTFDGEQELPVTIDDAVSLFGRVCKEDTEANHADQTYPEERATDAPIISFDGVSHGYRTLRSGTETVLHDVSVEFHPQERIALIGANGAGKSTLMKLITGVETPNRGTVSVAGTQTSDVLPETLAEDIVYVHQNPEDMFIADDVRSEIAHYLEARDVDDVERRVDDVIAYLDLEALQDRDGRLLSVGQQRRVSLAIGLATDPKIVLLDEPTGSLDLASREEVGRTISRADERVETVVIATHDLDLAASWANRIIVLEDGEVLADGHPRSILGQAELLERANVRPPQVVRLSQALDLSPIALSPTEFADRVCIDDQETPSLEEAR